MHYLYILLCSDKSYYTGISNSIPRRLKDHRKGKVIFTSKRLPVRLDYFEKFNTKQEAAKREREIKGWSRKKKKTLIEEFTPLKTYLGKTIAVKIDRPLGSKHPEHDFIYPLNYGFISETISSNAAPIDVYVLGVFKPVKMINGKVIAVIKRKDDNTDKIVIAANNKNYTNEQIQALVEFQERFFNTKIISNHKGL